MSGKRLLAAGLYTVCMIPPLEVILRRRHAARTGIRVAALVCLGRMLWLLSDTISGVTFPSAVTAMGLMIDQGFALIVWPIAATLLLVFERRLAAWLVPMPTPGNVCHQCGYSLKNLKSPICPECGADVGPQRR